MINLSKELLNKLGACAEGTAWFLSQNEVAIDMVVKKLSKERRFSWANWILTHLMDQQQNTLYACYSAKLSLKYFEKSFPEDKRPRLAIEAAIRWAKFPTAENKSAAESAESAAWSAWSAAESERSAAESAWSAAESAWSALSAAESAALSARSAAALSARSAESAAESAALSAAESAWRRILAYGLKLLLLRFYANK